MREKGGVYLQAGHFCEKEEVIEGEEDGNEQKEEEVEEEEDANDEESSQRAGEK